MVKWIVLQNTSMTLAVFWQARRASQNTRDELSQLKYPRYYSLNSPTHGNQ